MSPYDVLQIAKKHMRYSGKEMADLYGIGIYYVPAHMRNDPREAMIIEHNNGKTGIFIKNSENAYPAHTDFLIRHEIWHYINRDSSIRAMGYDSLNSRNSNEYPANLFAFFTLIPPDNPEGIDIITATKKAGIPFKIAVETLFRITQDSRTKHYYDAYF